MRRGEKETERKRGGGKERRRQGDKRGVGGWNEGGRDKEVEGREKEGMGEGVGRTGTVVVFSYSRYFTRSKKSTNPSVLNKCTQLWVFFFFLLL